MYLKKNVNVIPAMVRRHIEDMAFYWSQYDFSERSINLHIADLVRFDNMLQAHLAGTQVAGESAWPLAMSALQRWNKPGEAFACTCAFLLSSDAVILDKLATLIQAHPDQLLRGTISAIAWVPWQKAEKAIRRWTARNSDPLMLVAALRALFLIKNCLVPDESSSDSAEWLQTPLSELLGNSNTHVRAAACRLASLEDEDEQIKKLLIDSLHDKDLAVRAQAAIAVARLAQRGAFVSRHDKHLNDGLLDQSAEMLRQCIDSQISLVAAATGWYAKQAKRRLERWIEHLAWIIRPGAGDLTQILNSMPVHAALHFIAFHGDPAYLPFVIMQMDDPTTARYAGWVWQLITGIDLFETGLAMEAPDFSSDLTLQPIPTDADFGVVMPNGPAVARATPYLQSGRRYFHGQVIAITPLLDIIESGSQAIRSIAAQHLLTLDSLFIVSVRASAETQLRCVKGIKELMVMEGTI